MSEKIIIDIQLNDNASNKTLNQLKENLKTLKAEIGGVAVGSDAFNKLSTEIAKTNIQIKEINKGFSTVAADANLATNSISAMEDELKQLKAQISTVGVGSTEFNKLQTQILKVDTTLKNTKKSIEGLDVEQLAGHFGKLTSGIVSSFTAISAVIGNGNSDIDKFTKNIVSGIAVAQGLKGAFEGGASGVKIFNTFLKASPITTIAIAVGALTGALILLKNAFSDVETSLTSTNAYQAELNKNMNDYKVLIASIDVQLGQTYLTLDSLIDITSDLNEIRTRGDLAELETSYANKLSETSELVKRNYLLIEERNLQIENETKKVVKAEQDREEAIRNSDQALIDLADRNITNALNNKKLLENERDLYKKTLKDRLNEDKNYQAEKEKITAEQYQAEVNSMLKILSEHQNMTKNLIKLNEDLKNKNSDVVDSIKKTNLDRLKIEKTELNEFYSVQVDLITRSAALEKEINNRKFNEDITLKRKALKELTEINAEEFKSQQEFHEKMRLDLAASLVPEDDVRLKYHNFMATVYAGINEEHKNAADEREKIENELTNLTINNAKLEKVIIEKTQAEINEIGRTRAQSQTELANDTNDEMRKILFNSIKDEEFKAQEILRIDSEAKINSINKSLEKYNKVKELTAEEIKAKQSLEKLKLTLEEQTFEKSLELTELYLNKKDDLQAKYDAEDLQRQITHLDKLASIYEGDIARVADINKEKNDVVLNQNINTIYKTQEEQFKALDEEAKKKILTEEEVAAEKKRIEEDTLRSIDDLKAENRKKNARLDKAVAIQLAKVTVDIFSDLQQAQLNAVENRINTEYNAQVEAYQAQETVLAKSLDNSLITQSEYEAQLKLIEIEKQKAELKQRQDTARAEKEAALIKVAIETALAIAEAAPIVPLIAIAAATGAAQAAVIASQPIPTYSKGGILNGPSHSEGGVPIYSNGGQIAEAEGGEIILNKNVSKIPALAAMASMINVSTGGKAFTANPSSISSSSALTATVDPMVIQSIVNSTVKGIAAIPVQNVATQTTRVSRRVENVEASARY
jgi:hypothetical protein